MFTGIVAALGTIRSSEALGAAQQQYGQRMTAGLAVAVHTMW